MNRGITAELLKKNAAEKKRRTRWMREERDNNPSFYYVANGNGLWVIVEGGTAKITIRRCIENAYRTCDPSELRLMLYFVPLNEIRGRRQ